MLGIKDADARMRDTELLVRFIAFQTRLNRYTGRMKEFIDDSCIYFNRTWSENEGQVAALCIAFDKAAECLFEVFGEREVARRAYSQLFNRSIFDALAFYAAKDDVTVAMLERAEHIRGAYKRVVETQEFQEAVGSDTAGIPHTFDRLRIWGEALIEEGVNNLKVPTLIEGENKSVRIEY